MSHPFLKVEKLAKRHPAPRGGSPLTVFEDLSFGIDKGELCTIIGHSGCGKSTILEIVAGLSKASAGYVFVNGRVVSSPSLSCGVIFQNHSLLPWKTALGNVMFSVRARWPDWSRQQIKEHSQLYLRMVGLGDAEHRRPAQLSGGMRQRVGIARAFAIKPQVLLMDEPFGALDALTRATVQDELLAMWRHSGLTVFMITHDIDEALYLSDRVLLMSEGPCARLVEDVKVTLPRPRDRVAMLKDPRYYELRARLVDFLHGGRIAAPSPPPPNIKEEHDDDEARDEPGGSGGEAGKGRELGQLGRDDRRGRGVPRLVRPR